MAAPLSSVDAAPVIIWATPIPYGLTAWLLTQNDDVVATWLLTQNDATTIAAYYGSTCDAPAAI